MHQSVDEPRDAYIDLLKRTLLGQTVGPTTLLRPVEGQPDVEGRRARLARALAPSPGVPAEPYRRGR